jgi:hypothetical protein
MQATQQDDFQAIQKTYNVRKEQITKKENHENSAVKQRENESISPFLKSFIVHIG